jgi:hypothetical protein
MGKSQNTIVKHTTQKVIGPVLVWLSLLESGSVTETFYFPIGEIRVSYVALIRPTVTAYVGISRTECLSPLPACMCKDTALDFLDSGISASIDDFHGEITTFDPT